MKMSMLDWVNFRNMLDDTPEDFLETISTLGATSIGVDLAAPLMTYYFFNIDGKEIGHYIMDVDKYTTFDVPRDWPQDKFEGLYRFSIIRQS